MNKTSKIILAVVAVIAIAALAVLMAGSKKDQTKNSSNSESTTNSTPETPAAKDEVAATITYTSDGFSPSSVTVNSGDKIKFVNSSDSAIQPSSNPHPVHTDNPELNVGGIQPGESSTITVRNKGTWGMHNHFNSSQKITIIIR